MKTPLLFEALGYEGHGVAYRNSPTWEDRNTELDGVQPGQRIHGHRVTVYLDRDMTEEFEYIQLADDSQLFLPWTTQDRQAALFRLIT